MYSPCSQAAFKRSLRQLKELNEGALRQAGLVLRQVHDDTVYINSAIDLVQQNILVGGLLAALILMLFLRSIRATVIISLAIPVSVVGSFVAMAALGRSINVISMAGIAFAVGMVVDAAIVVLENIFRLRQQGNSPFEAALYGAKQVWGAVFVSALTTVMVFVPILVMKLEVGQLKALRYQMDHMHEFPVLLLICGKRDWPFKVPENERVGLAPPNYGAVYPCTQNILMACRAVGLGAALTTMHQVFEEALHERFSIPLDYGVVVTMPIGYPMGKFGPVRRIPASEKTYFDVWGNKEP